ncbi:MAG: 4Fe-4S dicluster domain-containing protein [Chlorobi bacterium]|nr:4Fe-4S dicluster domain-containing protein [Chlorobiota bacterium]
MHWLDNVIFTLILFAGIGYFAYHVRKTVRNIKLGRPYDRSDRKKERWRNMLLKAFGQQKMFKRPIPALLHLAVYLGFIIINIEVIEIIIDGIFGTHRVLRFMGGFYDFLIASFEILALLVIIAVTLFWIRRNVLKIWRFHMPEMEGWPKKDANIILYFEFILMTAFLTMNAADLKLQQLHYGHYYFKEGIVGSFPISQFLLRILPDDPETLVMIERTMWWVHIVGILIFLNYLYFSKHYHILLAFPNTFYAKLPPLAKLDNLESVKKQVELMLDPNADPYAEPQDEEEPERFGAKDIFDLKWVNLLNAYTCTECGRCSDVCPANATGKKLSPRKIMMDVRDRTEEVGRIIDKHGKFVDDGKSLLDYISPEEIWACTTCNACVEECPVENDPLDVIIQLRQYLVLEESAAPPELNLMFTNIENNGAPWQYSQADRLNWVEE